MGNMKIMDNGDPHKREAYNSSFASGSPKAAGGPMMFDDDMSSCKNRTNTKDGGNRSTPSL